MPQDPALGICSDFLAGQISSPAEMEASLQWEPSCYDRSSVGATMRKLILFVFFFLAFSTTIVSAQQFDLVLEGS